MRLWDPFTPSIRDPGRPRGPARSPGSRMPPPLQVLPIRAQAGARGVPRGSRPAAVVQCVLTPLPRRRGGGPGPGREARPVDSRGTGRAQGPGGRSGQSCRRPPAYILRLNLGCARSSSPSGTRFRRRRLGPAPAHRGYKAWAGRLRPAEPSPPACAPLVAHRCPKPRQPRVPAMALSEPILPSFSTFASPCRERGLQEVRAAGTAGAVSSG